MTFSMQRDLKIANSRWWKDVVTANDGVCFSERSPKKKKKKKMSVVIVLRGLNRDTKTLFAGCGQT